MIKREKVEKVVLVTSFVLFTCFFLYPFWIAIVGAFKTLPQILSTPVYQPVLNPTIKPFLEAWKMLQFPSFVSLKIALFATLISVVFGIMGGYSLIQARFKGAGIILALVLFALYIPSVTRLLPALKIIQFLKLYNTNIGVSIALGSMLLPISTTLYRQFFMQIPKSYFEAAALEGADHIQILTRIVIPLAKIPTVTVSVLSFAIGWNEYMLPLILTSGSNENRPIAITLSALKTAAQYNAEFNVMLAGALIAAILPVTLYLIAQKYVTEGFRAMGGLDK